MTSAESHHLREQLTEHIETWKVNEAAHLKQANSLLPWVLVPSATALIIANACVGLTGFAWCVVVVLAIVMQMIGLGASMRRGFHVGMAASAQQWLDVMRNVGKLEDDHAEAI